jgi:hypothetical protein
MELTFTVSYYPMTERLRSATLKISGFTAALSELMARKEVECIFSSALHDMVFHSGGKRYLN